MSGPWTGQVQHPDHARQPFQYTKVPSVVDVTIDRVAVVEGKTVLDENGQPAVGARLEFSNDLVAMDYWTRTQTDDRGRYKLATLPPGKYRMSVKLNGRPNLFRRDVPLHAGKNAIDLRMEKGGTIQGRVLDVTTGKPPQLEKGQRMDIGTCERDGFSFAGMNYAHVQPDGTFTMLVPAGRSYLGMYLARSFRGLNTDELLENGVEVAEGQILALEIRVEPHMQRPK